MKLSIVIPTLNEEKNIGGLLENIKDFADEIIVVDMYSTDETVAICRSYTDKIIQHEENKVLNININLGIEKAQGRWILQLDADERLTPELKCEIREAIESEEFAAYAIPFKQYFFGRFVEKGGWNWSIKRLYRKDSSRYKCNIVHEQINTEGPVGTLRNPIIHYAHPTVEIFLKKMNLYTSQAAQIRYQKGERTAIKTMILKPSKVFLYRYLRLRGYKEGIHGLVLSILMSIYVFCEEIKVWELSYNEKYNHEDLE